MCLLAGSLLSSGEWLKLGRAPESADGDNLYLNRFSGIKSSLPERGVVCYVPSPDSSFQAKKGYFLAQYALAPLVLRADAGCEPLIGNFPEGATSALLNQQHLMVVHDFGDGLLLMRRSSVP